MPENMQDSAMKAEQEKPRPYGTGYKLIGKDLLDQRPGGEGDREVEVCGRFSRRRDAVLPAGAEPDAACAREEHPRGESTGDAGGESDPDACRCSGPCGLYERQRNHDQGRQVGRAGA